MIGAVGCAVDLSRNAFRSKLSGRGRCRQCRLDRQGLQGRRRHDFGRLDFRWRHRCREHLQRQSRQYLTDYKLTSLTTTVAKSGSTVTSTVTFSATINTMFLGLIGKTALTMTGTSKATASMPLYIDFYLLLDNSPSMGVGATPATYQKMVNNTSDKCAFACHDLKDKNNYYDLAKKPG